MSFLDFLRQKLYPPDTSEKNIAKQIISDFREASLKRAPEFVFQVIKKSQEKNLPNEVVPYIFYLLTEKSNLWPTLTKPGRLALSLARDLMVRANKSPTYSNLQIPPEAMEHVVDQILIDLSVWAQGPLRANLNKDLTKSMAKQKRTVDALLAAQGIQGKSTVYLGALLMKSIEQPSVWFSEDGDLMAPLLQFVFTGQ